MYLDKNGLPIDPAVWNYQDMESVDHFCDKCESYAENWKPTAERLWNQKK